MQTTNPLSQLANALLLDKATPKISSQLITIRIGPQRLNGRSFLLKPFADGALDIGGVVIDLSQKLTKLANSEIIIDEVFRERVKARIKTSPEALNAFTLPLKSLEVVALTGNSLLYRTSLAGQKYIIKAIINKSHMALREMALSLDLNHPHIVRTYGSGLMSEHPSIIMEDVPGLDGLDYIKANGSVFPKKDLDLKEILKKTPESLLQLEQTAHRFAHAMHLFKEIVSGVEYLQSSGLVNRDLKAENLIINGNWNDPENLEGGTSCKIVDNGFLRRVPILREGTSTLHASDDFPAPIAALKRSYSTCGTLGGIAPEMAKGLAFILNAKSPEEKATMKASLSYDHKLDIFNLGAILHVFLLGKTVQSIPPSRQISIPYLSSIYNEKQQYDLRFPSSLQDLLNGLLEKNPQKRSSIAEIKENPLMTMGFEELKVRYIYYIHQKSEQLQSTQEKL